MILLIQGYSEHSWYDYEPVRIPCESKDPLDSLPKGLKGHCHFQALMKTRSDVYTIDNMYLLMICTYRHIKYRESWESCALTVIKKMNVVAGLVIMPGTTIPRAVTAVRGCPDASSARSSFFFSPKDLHMDMSLPGPSRSSRPRA